MQCSAAPARRRDSTAVRDDSGPPQMLFDAPPLLTREAHWVPCATRRSAAPAAGVGIAEVHLIDVNSQSMWGQLYVGAWRADDLVRLAFAVPVTIDQVNGAVHEDAGEETVADVLAAGTDVDCTSFIAQHGQSAYDKKLITDADIDARLKMLFRVRMRLGHFDPEGPLQQIAPSEVCSAAHREIARDGPRQSAALLKNDGGALPLAADPSHCHRPTHATHSPCGAADVAGRSS